MTSVPAVALGYQGFGNVGDEAILAGIESLLTESPLNVRLVIGGDRSPIPAMGTARRVTSRRLLPTPAAVRALRGGRVLLLAGGGLIHDHWPIVIPRYLAWSILARAMGMRIAWIGVGVGPIRHRWAGRLAAMAARLAHVVTVRDESSLAALRAVAPHVRASVVPDPAFFLAPPASRPRAGLALIVRRPVPAQAALAPGLASVMGAVARTRIAAGEDVTLLTMERGHDDTFAAGIAALAGIDGRSPPLRALPLAPEGALAELAGFEEVVSVRLHGLILCALAATPCVPIVYDDKVTATAARLGLGRVAVPLADITAERVAAALAAVRTDTFVSSVRDRVQSIRAERSAAAALITSVIDA